MCVAQKKQYALRWTQRGVQNLGLEIKRGWGIMPKVNIELTQQQIDDILLETKRNAFET